MGSLLLLSFRAKSFFGKGEHGTTGRVFSDDAHLPTISCVSIVRDTLFAAGTFVKQMKMRKLPLRLPKQKIQSSALSHAPLIAHIHPHCILMTWREVLETSEKQNPQAGTKQAQVQHFFIT
jgi:hypothetical protein